MPFIGISPVLVDFESETDIPSELNNVEGILCIDKPWPGLAM